jgi:hypothetical protein
MAVQGASFGSVWDERHRRGNCLPFVTLSNTSCPLVQDHCFLFSDTMLVVIASGQGGLLGGTSVALDFLNLLSSQLDSLVLEDRGLHQNKVGIIGDLLGKPEEGLLEIVVGLGRDIVVLKTLLAVEGDHLCLDLSVGAVNLVAYKNNGDVVAHAGDIAVPVGNVLVRVSRRNVEHDNSAVAFNVVTVTETAELFLASGIPAVKANLSTVGVEGQRVDINADGGNVALLELTSQVALDEGCLPRTTITDKDELEGGDAVGSRGLGHCLEMLLCEQTTK